MTTQSPEREANPFAMPPSQRGLVNLDSGKLIDMNRAVAGIPLYDPQANPDGLIDCARADNALMADYVKRFSRRFGRKYRLEQALEYGEVAGSEDLAKAVSKFVNRKFNPSIPVEAENILATNGVTALLDLLAFNICDHGEGILVPVPAYAMYEHDLCARSGLSFIPVSSSTMEDSFSRTSCKKLIADFSEAYDAAITRGIRVKAVLICNPSNPLGRFYSRETLVAIVRFCGQRNLHLVSDEIFAMSGFVPVEDAQILDHFTSVLSIPNDDANKVCVENIHVLYGASKDFGMGGLRLGFLITRNKLLWETCRRCALFTWVTSFSNAYFTNFLSNDKLVDEFVEIFQTRLKKRYIETTKEMRDNGIPYLSANGGSFVWIDLSQWLEFCDWNNSGFEMNSEVGRSPEENLTHYLIKRGVYLSMGEFSLSPTPGRFRFVYTRTGDEAKVAVKRIAEAMRDLESNTRESSTDDAWIGRKESLAKPNGHHASSFRKNQTLAIALRKFNCFAV